MLTIPDPWPINPTYTVLMHNGEVKKKGIVTQVSLTWVERPSFSASGLPDPLLKTRLDGHYVFTFHWKDGTKIAVTAEDGWSWGMGEVFDG